MCLFVCVCVLCIINTLIVFSCAYSLFSCSFLCMCVYMCEDFQSIFCFTYYYFLCVLLYVHTYCMILCASLDPQAYSQGRWVTRIRLLSDRGEHYKVEYLASGVECHGHSVGYFCRGWNFESLEKGLRRILDQCAEPSFRRSAENDAFLSESLIIVLKVLLCE